MELSASVVAHPDSVTGEFWCSVIERNYGSSVSVREVYNGSG